METKTKKQYVIYWRCECESCYDEFDESCEKSGYIVNNKSLTSRKIHDNMLYYNLDKYSSRDEAENAVEKIRKRRYKHKRYITAELYTEIVIDILQQPYES